MPSNPENGIVSFSSFQVDLRAGELKRNGFKVRLQEQPFQVLALLLQKPGEVVTREELHGRLWAADTFVDFDHGLNAAVKRLRDALGDSAENPRFVETVARRGYRFIAPVNAPAGTPEPAAKDRMVTALWVRCRWPRLAAALGVITMATGAGWVAARRINPEMRIVEQRLTANASDDPIRSAVISPDSKYLAFADRTGLFLRVVSTGETHAINLPAGFRARPTGWFPDGSRLLVTDGFVYGEEFGYREAQSLWSVSVLGGAPRKIADNARSGAVSPDGTQIAFIRTDGVNQEIWMSSLQGEQQRRIIDESREGLPADAVGEQYRRILGEPGDIFGAPVWSPDGKEFAFTRYAYGSGYHDGDVSLGICNPANGRVDFLLSNRRLGDSVAWTADGRIVYSLAEAPPNQRDSNLWAQQVDTRTGRLVGGARRLTYGPDVKAGLSYSAAGKRLSFLRRSSEPHIYIAQIEGGGERLSAPRPLGLEEGRNLPFSWTPDSASVLFISDREGTYHLFKQGVDQPAPDLVFDGPDEVMGARLNPDGSEALFLTKSDANDPEAGVRLMRVPVAGGTPQLVLQEPQVENMQCARLPSKLCLFSRNEMHAIRFFRFDPVSGAKTELAQFARTSELKFHWTLSADGSMLALSPWRQGPGPGEIQIFTIATGKQRTLTINGWAQISGIDWAADSRNIWAGASDLSGMQALLLIDLHGKARPMLQDSQSELGWAIPAPDGKHVAIWEASRSSNAWLLQGF